MFKWFLCISHTHKDIYKWNYMTYGICLVITSLGVVGEDTDEEEWLSRAEGISGAGVLWQTCGFEFWDFKRYVLGLY